MNFSDNYYVDCYFPDEADRICQGMGHRVSRHAPGAISPIFEERFREMVIPRDQWDDLYDQLNPNYARHKTWQYDQRNEGTCTSNATSGCLSYIWSKTVGSDLAISPAPPSMYYYCASGPNSGSSTDCNLKRARDHGCLLIDTADNRKIMKGLGLPEDHVLPAVGWNGPRRLPSEAMDVTAKQFRLHEFYEITSVDGFFSALLHGFDILYGRSGHAIHGVDIVKRDGSWHCKYDNSWGSWGDNGFGYDSISYVQRTSAYRWAYAFQTMRHPDNLHQLLEVPELTT